jgi:hypothetical protein
MILCPQDQIKAANAMKTNSDGEKETNKLLEEKISGLNLKNSVLNSQNNTLRSALHNYREMNRSLKKKNEAQITEINKLNSKVKFFKFISIGLLCIATIETLVIIAR